LLERKAYNLVMENLSDHMKNYNDPLIMWTKVILNIAAELDF